MHSFASSRALCLIRIFVPFLVRRLCLRNIDGTWYNLDSKLNHPEPYVSLQTMKDYINQVLVENGNLFVVTFLSANRKGDDTVNAQKVSTASKSSVSSSSVAPSKSSVNAENDAVCKGSSTVSRKQSSSTNPSPNSITPSISSPLTLSRPTAQLTPQPSLKRKRAPTGDPVASPKRPETLRTLTRNAVSLTDSNALQSTDSSAPGNQLCTSENIENSSTSSPLTLKKPRSGHSSSFKHRATELNSSPTLSLKHNSSFSAESTRSRTETLKGHATSETSDALERPRSRSRSEIRSRLSNQEQPLATVDTNSFPLQHPSSSADDVVSHRKSNDCDASGIDYVATHDKIVTSLTVQTSAPPISSHVHASSIQLPNRDSNTMSTGTDTPQKIPSSALHSRNASFTGMSDISDCSPAVSPRAQNFSIARMSSNEPMEDSKINTPTLTHRNSRSLRHELPPPTQVLHTSASGGERLVANGVTSKRSHKRNASNISDMSDCAL